MPSWREAQRGPCPMATTHMAQPLVCPREAPGTAPRPGRSGARPSSPGLACSGGRIPYLSAMGGGAEHSLGPCFLWGSAHPAPPAPRGLSTAPSRVGRCGRGGCQQGRPLASRWALRGGLALECTGRRPRTGTRGGAHPQERSGAASLTEWAPAAKGATGTLLTLSWGAPPQRAAALGGQKGPLGRDSSPREWGQRRSSQGAEDAAGSADPRGTRALGHRPQLHLGRCSPAWRRCRKAAACESLHPTAWPLQAPAASPAWGRR